jgi:hypothetical protein
MDRLHRAENASTAIVGDKLVFAPAVLAYQWIDDLSSASTRPPKSVLSNGMAYPPS